MNADGILRVAAAQPLTITGDIVANVAAHADAVRHCAADVVVFPELSLSGYVMDAPAVDPTDPVLSPLIDACADAGSVALVGGAVEHDGGRAIGILAVEADGARVVYRKMFLGGPEVDAYRPGTSPAVVEIDGWRVGLGVCKDTRIVEHLAATSALGMDLYVAGLVHAADEFDDRARDINTGFAVPVVFAGFAGPTGGGYPETCGGSAIWDAGGRRLAQATQTPGDYVVADVVRQ